MVTPEGPNVMNHSPWHINAHLSFSLLSLLQALCPLGKKPTKTFQMCTSNGILFPCLPLLTCFKRMCHALQSQKHHQWIIFGYIFELDPMSSFWESTGQRCHLEFGQEPEPWSLVEVGNHVGELFAISPSCACELLLKHFAKSFESQMFWTSCGCQSSKRK